MGHSNTGTLYDNRDNYLHITAAGTTTIRTKETLFRRVVVNSGAAGAGIKIHNGGPGGAIVANILATAAVEANYGVVLSGGLTVVTVGNPDVTVIYK